MRGQFAATAARFSRYAYLLDNQRFLLKSQRAASGEIRGYEEPISFDQQTDYQLDVLDAATEALHRAVIVRMLSARLVPGSETRPLSLGPLERDKASKLGQWKSTY